MRRALLGIGGASAVVVGVVSIAVGGNPASPLSAVLSVMAERVDLTPVRSEPRPARTGDRVVIGDSVNTDDTGRARLDYDDGSLARLGPGTELTIVELDTEAGRREVRTRLDVGQTWHRVARLAGTDSTGDYVVETAVATAAVRGTAFAVVCPDRDQCTFTVEEGEVEIEPRSGPPFVLRAGESVTITGDDIGEVVGLSPDQLRSEPWVAENLALDAEEDLIGDVAAGAEERRRAVIVGDWELTMTTVTSPGGIRDGSRVERRYRFELEDCEDAPCAVVATIESGGGQHVIPMAFQDGAYRFETSFLLACDDVADALRTTLRWRIEATDAEPDDHGWRATALTGTVEEAQEENRPSACEPGTLRHELTASRA